MNKPVTMEGSTILSKKIDRLDWLSVSNDLDGQGHAVIQHLLLARECEHVRALYECDELFRRRIVMGQHGLGQGEYQYFAYPLPAILARLRTSLIRIWHQSRIVGTG